MEITMQVKSCTREWCNVMVPISGNPRSRKKSYTESFLVVFEPTETDYGSADLYGIDQITVRIDKAILPGTNFNLKIEAAGAQ